MDYLSQTLVNIKPSFKEYTPTSFHLFVVPSMQMNNAMFAIAQILQSVCYY